MIVLATAVKSASPPPMAFSLSRARSRELVPGLGFELRLGFGKAGFKCRVYIHARTQQYVFSGKAGFKVQSLHTCSHSAVCLLCRGRA